MIKTILIGILGTILVLLTIKSFMGLPFEGTILYYSGVIVTGELISSESFVESGEAGTQKSYEYTYTYKVDGKNYIASKLRSGTLNYEYQNIDNPIDIMVIYSSIYPKINRISVDGKMSFFDFVVKDIFGTIFLYGLVIISGIYITKKAIQD